jgi:hypothetical protein
MPSRRRTERDQRPQDCHVIGTSASQIRNAWRREMWQVPKICRDTEIRHGVKALWLEDAMELCQIHFDLSLSQWCLIFTYAFHSLIHCFALSLASMKFCTAYYLLIVFNLSAQPILASDDNYCMGKPQRTDYELLTQPWLRSAILSSNHRPAENQTTVSRTRHATGTFVPPARSAKYCQMPRLDALLHEVRSKRSENIWIRLQPPPVAYVRKC